MNPLVNISGLHMTLDKFTEGFVGGPDVLVFASNDHQKLKNYKERIEEIVKTTEKVYSCQAQLFTFDKFLKTSLNMTSSEIIPD